MSRLAACPKCRNQFTLPELSGPATIACPFCGAHITIKMKQAMPPPAMVVQPAMAVAQAIPDDEEDYEEEEERPRKKKKITNNKIKKKKKRAVIDSDNEEDETWLKASILMGIFLVTILAVVGTFAWYIFAGKSGPKYSMPTGTVSVTFPVKGK